jgi:hypothetical protein
MNLGIFNNNLTIVPSPYNASTQCLGTLSLIGSWMDERQSRNRKLNFVQTCNFDNAIMLFIMSKIAGVLKV